LKNNSANAQNSVAGLAREILVTRRLGCIDMNSVINWVRFGKKDSVPVSTFSGAAGRH
jgi:hypothetical protein